jgi:hypothetical protein
MTENLIGMVPAVNTCAADETNLWHAEWLRLTFEKA